MRFLATILIGLVILGCQSPAKIKTMVTDYGDTFKGPGKLGFSQVATSSHETFINVMAPRNREYKFAIEQNGQAVGKVEVLGKTTPSPLHWQVINLRISELNPGTQYRLLAQLANNNEVVDSRLFSTFKDKWERPLRFALGSCMSEDFSFKHIQDKIWDHMLAQNPDFIVLNGDVVYVDSYDFVPRDKATETDIWQRYLHSIEVIPLFHREKLVPILATWDDHDYGTNDSDKTFAGKGFARQAFQAFFGSPDIANVHENGKGGVYKLFQVAGQRFFLLDNRYFREARGSKNAFAHWGREQHSWLINHLKANDRPAWLINGGQFFAPAILIDGRDGKKRQINETFMADHPVHFRQLMNDLKSVKAPVLFASGDIHFSELLEIEANQIGYKTFELTSSPLHSYIFRNKPGEPELWDNPRRIAGAKDHNYLLIETQLGAEGWVNHVQSLGMKQNKALFSKKLVVNR